jgi:hypothetical protein
MKILKFKYRILSTDVKNRIFELSKFPTKWKVSNIIQLINNIMLELGTKM